MDITDGKIATPSRKVSRLLGFARLRNLRYPRSLRLRAISVVVRFRLEDPGSEGFDRLEFLSVLLEHYEEVHYPIGRGTPQQVVTFMLQQKGLNRSDLDAIMGGKSRVSEFFSGKRELSKSQIEGLRRTLGIPADILLGFD